MALKEEPIDIIDGGETDLPGSLNSEPSGEIMASRGSLHEERDFAENEKHALRNSTVTVTDDGRHACGTCGRTLASQWGLDAHVNTVHGRKSFECELCRRAFGRRDHLANHTNSVHTGDRECSQCGAMCKGGQYGLKNHVRENHTPAPAHAAPRHLNRNKQVPPSCT